VFAGEGADVRTELVVTGHHQGAPGLAHGGLLVSALDEAMGFVTFMLQTPAVTGRLETDFRLPVPVGSLVHIGAQAVAVAGRRVYMQAEGRLETPDGPVAVRALAVFVQVPLEHFTTHGRAADVATASTRGARPFEVNP
jgi:acyl-coenzyme A thioesterase PaaI-like protein